MKKLPAIDNLFEGDKEIILNICDKLMQETATMKDLSTVVRIAQQNHNAFDTFSLSLLLRLAEGDFRGDNILDSYEYLRGNIYTAFDLPETWCE